MKKIITIILTGIMMVSCRSQTDLEKLEFDTDISKLLTNLKDKNKDNSMNITSPEYMTRELSHFKIGDISLNDYAFDNYYYTLTNKLYFAVNKYTDNQYIGFSALIRDPKKEQELVDYFKSKMGKPIKIYINIIKEEGYLDEKYLWDDAKNNRLVYIYRHHTQDKKGNTDELIKFVETEFVIVKRDLIGEPDKDNDPENIRRILEENPRAFEIIEILKNRFP